jgi:hypothetical protein
MALHDRWETIGFRGFDFGDTVGYLLDSVVEKSAEDIMLSNYYPTFNYFTSLVQSQTTLCHSCFCLSPRIYGQIHFIKMKRERSWSLVSTLYTAKSQLDPCITGSSKIDLSCFTTHLDGIL